MIIVREYIKTVCLTETLVQNLGNIFQKVPWGREPALLHILVGVQIGITATTEGNRHIQQNYRTLRPRKPALTTPRVRPEKMQKDLCSTSLLQD